jgi:hypothetical protein
MQATMKQTAERGFGGAARLARAEPSSVDQTDAREAPREDRLAAHDALIRDIAADARIEPERYLKETIVPEGGE